MIKKKLLILGGEGFIGRNIADCMSLKHNCFSLDAKKSIFSKKSRKDKFFKINPYKNKIRNDYDAIVHLIDNGKNGKLFENNEKKLIKNIGLNKKNHLIVFSSAAVYANPDSDYGKRKKTLEKIYQNYCAKNKIKLLVLRLFNIYGPYQLPERRGSLVANIFCNYLNGNKIIINNFRVERDFIYSGDVAKVIRLAIERKFEGVDDLATNKMTSIRDLIRAIENIAGRKVNIVEKNIAEVIFYHKAESDIVKNIKLSELEKGLSETFSFYKNNLKTVNKEIYGGI